MKEEIIDFLKKHKDDFISGQDISDKLGVSRTAVWKCINQIKEAGYEIESVSRKGYKLISSPDILVFQEIKDNLNTKYIGKKIIYFDSIDSTNIKAKELASENEKEGTVIIGEEQTLGRGRLGRNWSSPKYKGIWMSIILKPDINPMEASKVTQIAAAAVVQGIKEIGIKVHIKWPNDIILKGKKICGILTEMSGEINKINYMVVGIGINVNIDKEDFPENISNIASSLKIETGQVIKRKELVGRILNNFEELYDDFIKQGSIKKSIDICRENSILIGKEVKVINRNKVSKAKALDIDEEGSLVVKNEKGEVHKLISGEVSIRGLYGYVDE